MGIIHHVSQNIILFKLITFSINRMNKRTYINRGSVKDTHTQASKVNLKIPVFTTLQVNHVAKGTAAHSLGTAKRETATQARCV